MSNALHNKYSESYQIGNKRFSWELIGGLNAYVYVEGDTGPSVCLGMIRSISGAIKIRSYGNWKCTLDQHEWAFNKCIQMFRAYDSTKEQL